MSAIQQLLLAGGGQLDVADVFATSLYTGNGGTQAITNGIDLAGWGGLVWIKDRSGAVSNTLQDTVRGMDNWLVSNTTAASIATALGQSASATGFTAKNFFFSSINYNNASAMNYVAWTFRKAPRFFDIVTYTGDGVNRTIAHGLGVAPGRVVVKRLDAVSSWRGGDSPNFPGYSSLILDSTAAYESNSAIWNNTPATDSVISLGTHADVNASGGAYVAYLFAHDPSPYGIIKCGGYSGNGNATGPVVTLGWEPQWLLVKKANGVGDWVIYDKSRDTANPRTYTLFANTAGAEVTTGPDIDFTTTGFQIKSTASNVNAGSDNYLYIAIRKP